MKDFAPDLQVGRTSNAWACLLVVLCAGGTLLHAEDDNPIEQEGELYQHIQSEIKGISEAELDKRFNLLWPDVARKYVTWNDRFFAMPAYARQLRSSQPLSNAEAIEKFTNNIRYKWADEHKHETLPPSPIDLKYYLEALPAVQHGQWGRVAGMHIEEILGPDQMRVSRLMLIDPKQLEQQQREAENVSETWIGQQVTKYEKQRERMSDHDRRKLPSKHEIRKLARLRLDHQFALRKQLEQKQREWRRLEFIVTGFDTEDLNKRERWPLRQQPAELVFVRDGKTLRALPLQWMQQGLNEQQFLRMLEQLDIPKREYVILAIYARRIDPRHATDLILRTLEARRALTEDEAPPAEQASDKSETDA